MNNRPVLLFIIFLLFFYGVEVFAGDAVPAFPGAEGHGRYTSGGRGGVVYYVETLEDHGQEGSLRYGIEKIKGPRTILFKVSGTIFLNKELDIKQGDLTIAGQTAPGDGICLAGWPVTISADNVILRFLRFRMGDMNPVGDDGADALEVKRRKYILIDHCSLSWCTDECGSFYYNDYFTLQWCILSESLRLSGHEKGPHGYGGIWGGIHASFHHNLLAHHDSRNPRFGLGSKPTPYREIVDFRNNIIYNWASNSAYGGEAMHINLVNNYYKPGPATPTGVRRGRIFSPWQHPEVKSWGKFYIHGNVVADDSQEAFPCMQATVDNWANGVYNQIEARFGEITPATRDSIRVDLPFPAGGILTHTAAEAYRLVLKYAGCALVRDEIDTRIVEEVRTGTATFKGRSRHNGKGGTYKSKQFPKPGIIDSQHDLKPVKAAADWSPWPELKQGEVPVDTDGDGIPDVWEMAHGLDPHDPADGLARTIDPVGGYTNLEMYLNSLVERVVCKK
ncbi:MAG: pectate lyase [Tannerellaceae bacterium]|nr:pectate lyase [Tannerellaceae bacterium]